MVCQVALVGGAAVNVSEIAVCRNPSCDRLPQRFGGRGFGKAKLYRARGCRSDREQQVVSRRIAGPDQQRGGAAELGERSLPERGPLQECRSRQVNFAQQLARTKDVGVI